MQLPIVNLNGTSPSELLEQHLLVCRHIRHAIEALQEACPHGRDYQTLGGEKALCDGCAEKELPLKPKGEIGRHWDTDFKWAPWFGGPCHACGLQT